MEDVMATLARRDAELFAKTGMTASQRAVAKIAKRRAKRKRDKLAEWANSLTAEQACRLIQIADPLTDAEQATFGAMSDDDLLAELMS